MQASGEHLVSSGHSGPEPAGVPPTAIVRATNVLGASPLLAAVMAGHLEMAQLVYAQVRVVGLLLSFRFAVLQTVAFV